MSNPQQSNAVVSPVAYVQTQYQEACQELGVDANTLVLMLVFDFLKIKPEDRDVKALELKRQFNDFTASCNMEEVQKEIDAVVSVAEDMLHNKLSEGW